ncbi:MAG: hypothetical protein AB1480_11635 [Nitrospirota bacterium]
MMETLSSEAHRASFLRENLTSCSSNLWVKWVKISFGGGAGI